MKGMFIVILTLGWAGATLAQSQGGSGATPADNKTTTSTDTPNDMLRGGPMVEVKDFDFRIDRHEVTNAEFAIFLNQLGNGEEDGIGWIALDSKYVQLDHSDAGYSAKEGFADHPVVEVSWYGAKAYCAWAGKRLPTETEWQRACEGTEKLNFPWGGVFEAGRANISGAKDGFVRTAPVGSFPQGASPYGALDMGGNVWEWTEAAYVDSAHLRGGSWVNGKSLTRCSSRTSTASDHSYVRGNTLGLRCVR